MIEIEKSEIIEAESDYDLTIEQTSLRISKEIPINKEISVIRYEDDNYYSVEFSNDFSNKDLLGLFDTDFKNFLTQKGKSIDYEISLPSDTITGCEFFDSFTQVIYLGKRDNKAYLRIQLAQDFYIGNTEWSKYSIFYLYEKLIEMGKVKNFDNVTLTEGDDDTEELVRILFDFELSDNINASLRTSFDFLPKIANEFERFFNSKIWNNDYLKDEPKFSKELILPLLRKMKFDNVQYNHGKKEYGKDFLFSEANRFGESVYYGMQVKAGNISGKVNGEIDMLIGQLKDAISMPFYLLGNKNPYYISTFIIVISGNFMENAKEKITHKIPPELLVNVFFWDKEKLLELIEKYWNK
jgi:hypothetical protein